MITYSHSFVITTVLMWGIVQSITAPLLEQPILTQEYIDAIKKEVTGIQEKTHFSIVITSYNNEAWIDRNLASVQKQDYQNYDIIYVNDASTDKTHEIVEKLIKKQRLEDRCTYIRNPARAGSLANHYQAVHHYCSDESVAIMLDGDDELAHPYVLSLLNKYYKNEDIWLTYGQYIRWCKQCQQDPIATTKQCKHLPGLGWSAPIPEKIIENHAIRHYKWVTSHLRTFKAWLFKHIKLKDLIHEHYFFDIGTDIPAMIPMIEAAARHGHVAFIPTILYIYNRDNPISCWKKQAPTKHKTDTKKIIATRRPYPSLKHPLYTKHHSTLKNIQAYVQTPQAYDYLKKIYPAIDCMVVPENNYDSSRLINHQKPYTLFVNQVKKLSPTFHHLHAALRVMEQTHADYIALDQDTATTHILKPHFLFAPFKIGIQQARQHRCANILIHTNDIATQKLQLQKRKPGFLLQHTPQRNLLMII